ncbi:SufS family cysteine desulfurase [Candidatus Poseidonia alphae]|nr:SufS family cysteine desulfurase [bacterium]MDA8748599.1 SufS family cysteine desulfurase [Candidatus Poseidonia alphae]MDA8758928.1 SufS family cysteine desulfurase [Candidatus Poseidonia alphae]MDB2335541.1 SufS family cysteine desulfurase [Candidatus Poseidonia alphae]
MLRDQFPILQRKVNGYPLIYLDNAATTQKPQVVLDAMNDYYSKSNANVHRAVHTLAGEATEGYESCRSKLKQRYNADRAILTSGTTEAINLVAHAWGRAKLTSGDVIVLTEMEHHSDIVPWQMLAEERGVELRYVPVAQDFTLDMEAFDHALDGAALVCVVHTSNVLGVRNPLEEIIEKSRAVGARVLIDAAQGLPHSTVDFQAFGADFMAFSAHKMCGPTGIGALLVTQSAFDEMEPFMGGGDMIETVTIEGSTYQTNEHKFEAGTPRIAEAVGWTAALEWMESFDLDKEHSRLIAIASWVAEQLRGLGMSVYGRHGEQDAAVVSFLHPTINSEDMAHLLDARGFAVRTGHHCAQPLLHRLGISGTVRASFYVYNTREEAEAFVDELRSIVEKFA